MYVIYLLQNESTGLASSSDSEGAEEMAQPSQGNTTQDIFGTDDLS